VEEHELEHVLHDSHDVDKNKVINEAEVENCNQIERDEGFGVQKRGWWNKTLTGRLISHF